MARREASTAETGSSATISFGLSESGAVRLLIYDVEGRLVRTLVDGLLVGSGSQRFPWDGCDDRGRTLSSGVYFCRLDAGSIAETRRLVLLK